MESEVLWGVEGRGQEDDEKRKKKWVSSDIRTPARDPPTSV